MRTDTRGNDLDPNYVPGRWTGLANSRRPQSPLDIPAIFVPVAMASGSMGWGVPHVRGVPLKHR